MATRKNGTITHGSGNDKNYKINGDDGNKYKFKDESQSGQFNEGERVSFDVEEGSDEVTNVTSSRVTMP